MAKKESPEEIEKREQYILGLVKQMTLEEKIGMIHGAGLFRNEGVPRLGIPPLKMSDGPMGVRQELKDDRWKGVYDKDDLVTYLPSNSAIAATWNPKLAKACGKVLGEEARGRGKDVILAPGINIKRTPLCGRNFEYMSEDPYLVSEMTVPLIKGIQKNDVAACVKHFAVNGQETNRLWVDTAVDERTLHEIYLPGFEAAVHRGNSYAIMGAYNMLNGQHCCESKALLGKLLRREWGYDGAVISDWGGVHDTAAAAKSALDLEMSVTFDFDRYCLADPLKEAVKRGEISEKHVDEKVRNLLRLMYRLKMLPQPGGKRRKGCYHSMDHMKKALMTAREAVILLKNEDGLLPLKNPSELAVIGENARCIHSNGGGSAEIKAIYEVTPLMALMNVFGGDTKLFFEPGYVTGRRSIRQAESWQAASLEDVRQDSGTGSEAGEDTDPEKKIKRCRDRAVRLARSQKQVVLFAGLNHDYDVEGMDKATLKLPYHQDELIEAVLDANPNTVVVLMGGAPVEMDWLAKAKAVVWYYYSGLEGATAVAEVLSGSVNPSGKLPETFPKHTSDLYPVKLGEFGKSGRLKCKDGIFVGYRYYVTDNVETNFCFGHGLSYTEFALKEPQAEREGELLRVSATLTNIGKKKGKEVVQLYVTAPDSAVPRPAMELKGFKKVMLKPQESKKVTFELEKSAFSFYDVKSRGWKWEPGRYILSLGNSVENIWHRVEIRL